eukprot:scaffold7766_cov277-Pinguiococcus_pyrenoidosus.AAC.1
MLDVLDVMEVHVLREGLHCVLLRHVLFPFAPRLRELLQVAIFAVHHDGDEHEEEQEVLVSQPIDVSLPALREAAARRHGDEPQQLVERQRAGGPADLIVGRGPVAHLPRRSLNLAVEVEEQAEASWAISAEGLLRNSQASGVAGLLQRHLDRRCTCGVLLALQRAEMRRPNASPRTLTLRFAMRKQL